MEPKNVFKFCPRCAGKLDPKEESLQCELCGFHLYINPIPCNGVIIENDKGEILLVKRKYDPQKGYWDVPGGFARIGEGLEESVKREIREELGVDVELIKILGIYIDKYIFQEVENQTFAIIVNARITGGILKSADDVEEFRYFAKDQVLEQDIAFPGIKQALEKYLRNEIR
jgi:ADP-ribose pyrophosphatase YjhB (NUDIX family)